MVKKPVITLLTDFGLKDSYVAEMKAVILSICPKASIVDISHDVEPYNIRMAAYLLARSVKFFPKGTVHVAVVDPTVGSSRRPIIVEIKNAFLVGPDNGVLMFAAEKLGVKDVYKIENKDFMLPNISKTFHGRDIFAPAAAYLALGISPKKFGEKISDYVKPPFVKPKISGRKIEGEVLHIDNFGNIVTNISEDLVKNFGLNYGAEFDVSFNGKTRLKVNFLEAYFKVKVGDFLATTNSGGFLEFSANMANAAKILKVKPGMKVNVFF